MKKFYLIPTTIYDRMNNRNTVSNNMIQNDGVNPIIEEKFDEDRLFPSINTPTAILQKGAGNPIIGEKSVRQPTFVTSISPPLKNIVRVGKPMFKMKKKQMSKRIKNTSDVFLKTMNPTGNRILKNPSLSNLVASYFPRDYLSRAEGVAKICENSIGMQWDERGDLLSPINNYNVLDIIDKIIHQSTTLSSEHLQNFKYMLNMISYPIEFIINKHLRGYMSDSKLPNSRFIEKNPTTRNSGSGKLTRLNQRALNQWISY